MSCGKAASRLAMLQPPRNLLELPLDFPLSIKELARRPLLPRLLRRCPFSTPFLISLFRLIIGVSANGRAIFVASNDISTCSEDFRPLCPFEPKALLEGSVSVPLASVGLLSFCLLFFTCIGCGSGSIRSPLCLGLLLLFSPCSFSRVEVLSVNSRGFFFDRFAGGGFTFSGDSSSMGSGGFAISALAFLERVRAKANPSSSSS